MIDTQQPGINFDDQVELMAARRRAIHRRANELLKQAMPGPETEEHTSITNLSTMDMGKALTWGKSPGQRLDPLCAARDSNPEPAD